MKPAGYSVGEGAVALGVNEIIAVVVALVPLTVVEPIVYPVVASMKVTVPLQGPVYVDAVSVAVRALGVITPTLPKANALDSV